MNPCLVSLFSDASIQDRVVRHLPEAFQIVEQRMPKGNPAIGILREHVLTGFFIAEFGEEHVKVPESGVARSADVVLCDSPLSIKTLTGDNSFKILWTADSDQVEEEISSRYEPEHDIFLVNIFWNQFKENVFYIPVSAQRDSMNELGRRKYLSSAGGTNNRGIELRRKTIRHLKAHRDSLSFAVNWKRTDMKIVEPWTEWEAFWRFSR